MNDLFADILPPVADERPHDDRILIGTSGYSFEDWVGPFYPRGTRPSDFLRYYARHFDAVEINASHYRVPTARTMEQMERKTPPDFRFVVKVHRTATHEGLLGAETRGDLPEAVAPIRAAGKFDGWLAQFPWAFRRTPGNLAFLERLRETLPGDPLFVEFRHDSWVDPELVSWLRERGLGFVAVDEPALRGLMPPVTPLTSADGYVRFHGRNADTWWGSAAGGDRYDYDYRPEELREWVRRVTELAEQARRTYLFFNNCHAGQAARNAKLMQELMRRTKA